MGLFDHVLLHPGVKVDGYPFDASMRDGRWRWWQTKELHPSLDHYFIRPFEDDDQRLALFRRVPPVTRWTTTNEGSVDDNMDDVVDDADHWRHVRFDGEMGLTDISEDHRHYHLKATFSHGFLDDIWLENYAHTVDNDIPVEYRDIEITPRRS